MPDDSYKVVISILWSLSLILAGRELGSNPSALGFESSKDHKQGARILQYTRRRG